MPTGTDTFGIGAHSGLWADAMLCEPQLASSLHTLRGGGQGRVGEEAWRGGRVGEEAWGFDVFAFGRLCKQKVGHGQPHYPATLLTYYLIHQHSLLTSFPSLDRAKLLNWLQAVESRYLPSNAYHTSLHAAAVVASLHFFLSQPLLARQLSPLDRLAALVAAMVHDAGHPGVNNGFLEATRADVAITYNDQAVLHNRTLSPTPDH